MSESVSRRKFLLQSGAGSFAALTVRSQFSALSVGEVWAQAARGATGSQARLSDSDRELLRAVADEIIPAADGCMSATEAGAVDYVETLLGHVPDLQKQFQAARARLEALTKSRFRRPFDQLSSRQRVRALETFEKESARLSAAESLYSAGGNLFAILRDLIYEGYYTSPKVWPQLGYIFHATNASGPEMAPFDESILAAVRNRPKNYREAK